jgi:Kef-type K+ transport system membrane component KefB
LEVKRIAETLIVVPTILIVAFVLGELFKKAGFPAVVGQILAGMILGVPVIESLLFGNQSAIMVVDFLSILGIVFLLFLAGLELRFEKVKETSKDSILVSLSSAIVPFVLGFVFLRALGYDLLMSLVFGGALMVTSEGTKVKVLMDLNSLDTRLGAIMLAAGAIDDIFEVLFLSFVIVLAHGGSFMELAMIPLQLVVFVVVAFLFFKAISRVLFYLERNSSDETELFSMIVIFVLVLAALSETLRLGYLIGAIIGGFLIQISMRNIHPRHKEDMIRVTKMITLAFVVPFFFANVGLKFNLETIFVNMPLLIGTIAIAFIGKILGALVVKPASSLSLKQLYYVGWAMNSRGAAELVIALLALQFHLITPEIFSALVTMAMITTFTFPFILSRGIKKNPGLMDVLPATA